MHDDVFCPESEREATLMPIATATFRANTLASRTSVWMRLPLISPGALLEEGVV